MAISPLAETFRGRASDRLPRAERLPDEAPDGVAGLPDAVLPAGNRRARVGPAAGHLVALHLIAVRVEHAEEAPRAEQVLVGDEGRVEVVAGDFVLAAGLGPDEVVV